MAMRMPVCVSCGCTNDQACPGGCSWVSIDPPLCSACVDDDLHGGIGDAALLDHSGDRCSASPVGGPHKPIFITEWSGHCAACHQPFSAREAA